MQESGLGHAPPGLAALQRSASAKQVPSTQVSFGSAQRPVAFVAEQKSSSAVHWPARHVCLASHVPLGLLALQGALVRGTQLPATQSWFGGQRPVMLLALQKSESGKQLPP